MDISIIGFGEMGQFLARHLKKDYNLLVTDVVDKSEEAKRLGVRFVSLDKAAKNDILILFVPISKIADCCKSIAPHLKRNAVVIEGCSVMSSPIEAMLASLPPSVDIIGIHPLFGPASGKDGINGLDLVFSPVRTKRADMIRDIFISLKLNVIEMAPVEHDRMMAKTQALEQYIGRILIDMDIKKECISLKSYDLLLQLKEMLKDDSLELFKLIQNKNPFAKIERERFKTHLRRVDAMIDEK